MSYKTRRGRLKIYLGYAAGVGKTYRMLEDAGELQERGTDVVLGFLEGQGRSDVNERAKQFETIPLLRVACRGSYTEEIDVVGILRRAPKVCVIDDLAHTNAPGSERQRRWQDVQVLLDGGIDVLTTMNVQDLASLSDQILQITGLRVRETVPDWIFQEADEVVMVDVTPRALLHRLERGVIYAPERAKAESERLFQEQTLVALRELAIRQTAQVLEARAGAKKQKAETREERILVHVTADPSTAMLLRRARRVADYLHASCLAVYLCKVKDFASLPAAERQAVERHFRFAEDLRVETAVVTANNAARGLVDYAHEKGVTQVFIGPAMEQPKRWFRGLDFTDQVLYQARDLEVTVVAERSREGGRPALYPEDEAAGLMHSGFVRISEDMTVEEAIGAIRRQAENVEMIYYAYALDDEQHLAGVVSFRELVSAERAKKVRDTMRKDYVFVPEDEDKEVVAQMLARHRLLAVPVLDAHRHMLGIVSSADLAGVVQQAASEDILKIGGMEALEGPYMDVTFAQMIKKRAGWLAILFLGEMLTATAMGYFSDEISRAVVLALFIPLIISSGGNSGSQATTLVIRAMALGEIRLRDWYRVIRRELLAGLTLGAILGIIGITRIFLWHVLRGTYGEHYGVIALTIGCSLIGVVMFGTLAGSMLPFILRGCGLDPASASAPFVATLVDVTGLIIYFSVASVILRGVLL
ncbi:MAG TPA: magnesium transporter [Candidatus Eisenbacteria bacterium]|jgi:magnesium transporter|nr:magnesium transporter [Candidatus Eisenbacteria bacterium]